MQTVNAELLQSNTDSFLPRIDVGVVAENIIFRCVNDRAYKFWDLSKPLSTLKPADRSRETEDVVQHLSVF